MLIAVAGLVVALVALWGGVAGASPIDAGGTTTKEISHTDISLNLLWVVIGAVLVIFMQAGFALVETGFCRAKHAAHVVSTNFAVFGLGFVAFYIVGYAPDVRWLHRAVDRLDGGGRRTRRIRELDLPVEGRILPSGARVRRVDRGVLPVHGRVHGHDRDHSDRCDGRAVEVERVRRVGFVLRRDLLPAVRCVDMGRRLAGQARRDRRTWATATPTSPVRAWST